MDKYVAEIRFGNRADMPVAIMQYNEKAKKFHSGLSSLELKYRSVLTANNVNMGVETVDNIDNCTIKLKSFPEGLPREIQEDIIGLFNTTWSQ